MADFDLEREAQRNIEARTKIFGEAYQKVILELVECSCLTVITPSCNVSVRPTIFIPFDANILFYL